MLEIRDPFIPGNVFRVDPAKMIAKCKAIYERRGRDHARCVHCPELREVTARALEAEILLGALEPVVDPETIHNAISFEESVKPWGNSCAGPTDTQPIKVQAPAGWWRGRGSKKVDLSKVDPDESVTGFEVVDVDEAGFEVVEPS